MIAKVIPPYSIKAFRYRVYCLGQSLWQEQDPVCRANLALQLADAATTLARLEAQEAFQSHRATPANPESTPQLD